MKLDVDGLRFCYDSREILHGVCMEILPGETVGILGPNGSGKTTLIRCLNRVLTPIQGSVMLDGREIGGMPRLEVARGVGYVPQAHVNDIVSPNVFETVLMGRRPHVTWDFSSRDKEIAWKAMEDMDVKHLAAQEFSRLSSGQMQRVLIARAIAQEARILLLDEPTSNLDVKYQLEVMRIIVDLARNRGVGACVIVHDLDLAIRFCDKVILMDGGSIMAAGSAEDVLTPKNIRDVYEVEAVVDRNYGRPRIVVL